MPRIAHIMETCLYGADLRAMERFYSEVLGLVKMGEDLPRHVFFRVSERNVLLLFNPDETVGKQEVPSHGARGPGHVAFAIDSADLCAWKLQLAQHDVATEREIAWPNGAQSVYFRDPAGNSVELVTRDVWEGKP